MGYRISLLLAAASLWSCTSGRSAGPPAQACTTLSPSPVAHQAPPQTSPPPYELVFTLPFENGSFYYTPGETYTIMLRQLSEEYSFRGFMLQGRLLADDSTPAGTFFVTDSRTTLSACPRPEISVVHNSRVLKQVITTNWTAPPAGSGPLRIGYAVVRVRREYWANQRSPVILEREGDNLFPFGPEVGDSMFPQLDDGNTGPLNSTIPFPVFGSDENIFYLNPNGLLSFGTRIDAIGGTFLPTTFLAGGAKLAAPFWTDHDVRIAGRILYRFTDDVSLLTRVGASISAAFDTSFSPLSLFVATWDGVPRFAGTANEVNTYQAVIATDGSTTYAMFLYQDIQWSTDFSTIVGLDSGDTINGYSLPESLNATLLRGLGETSNVGVPGEYYFRIDQEEVILPPGYQNFTLMITAVDELNVTEGNSSSTNHLACYEAIVSEPVDRAAAFAFAVNESTASFDDGSFFPTRSEYVVIPAGFSGPITDICINVTVFGDTSLEMDELIAYQLLEVSDYDRLEFTTDRRRLAVRIINDDEPPLPIRLGSMLPFGEDYGDEAVSPSLNGASSALSIPGGSIPFYGNQETTLYVNINGVLSFQLPFDSAVPRRFPAGFTQRPMIVPFWAHHDIREQGQVLYRFTDNETLLSEVGTNISDSFATSFSPTTLFIATWNVVPERQSNFTITNTYQAVIATDGSETYTLFLYGDIQWGDTNTLTAIGFNAGDQQRGFTLPESFIPESVLNLESKSNVGIPGVYYFRVDQEMIAPPPDYGVFVMAILQTDQIEVLEPPSGQMNVELCLVAEVPEPFHRDAAVFDVVPNDNLTTADLFSDYFSADLLTPTYITVPAGVSGEMSFCLNFTIFSDNVRNEGDEIIRLDLQELSESYDLAIFASTAAFLSITIVENNGTTPPPVQLDNLLPYGTQFGDEAAFLGDDDASLPITFPGTSIPFYGGREDIIYVNSNGVISFRDPFTAFAPVEFPHPFENATLIAPYWSDHNPSIGGQILYRFTDNETLLDEVAMNISEAFGTVFSPTWLFVATYYRIPQFGGSVNIGNTYQVVMATDENSTYVLFLYGDIQWSADPFIGVGFNAGDMIRGFNLFDPGFDTFNLLSTSNVGIPGAYYFRVDQDDVSEPPSAAGVMLTVMLPPENVTEPRNSTQLITVRACFTTFIDQPLDREVAFEFVMSPLTTATFGVDFLPVLDSTFLIIPRNFSGFFDQCVPIEIYGDDEVEGTEVIAYDLVPLSDLDSVVFPPGRNLTLRIMDRVDVMIEFEQSVYEVREDIGADNLALRVCLRITNLRSERTIRLSTLSATALAGLDYVELVMDIQLRIGEERSCVGIVILEDSLVEQDEAFAVTIQELGVGATLVILDDDMPARYVGNTPAVRDNTVTFDLLLSSGATAARCALLIGDRVQNETDCSTGKAALSLQRARHSEYTPRVIVQSNNETTVMADTDRNLRLGVRGRCSVHLVDRGITRANFNIATTIEWGLSAPSHVIQSQVAFMCSLDGGAAFQCSSPYTTINIETNPDTITVTPTATGGCEMGIGRMFRL